MSQTQSFANGTYQIPVQGDVRWGPALTRYLVALGTYAMSPAGGTYTLTADLNLGASFGLIAAYYKSASSNLATAGVLRLANTNTIAWRNFANGGNLLLGVNASDQLTFNGTAIQPAITLLDGEVWIGNASNLPIGRVLSGAITTTNTGVTSLANNYVTNAMVNSSAAIAYSKLNLSGSILNSDIFSSAGIAYSKLSLTDSIIDADINSAAAIAMDKLEALTASRVPVLDASGFLTASSVTSTTLSYLDATSSIQTQLNAKQASGNYITALTGDVTASGPGSVAATLATVNADVGSFTLASITVNAKGLITAASSGSAVVTSVSGTANQITSTGGTTPVLALASPLTTPGAVTVTGNLTFTPTTAGVVGTTTNDNAASGVVGEYVSSTVGATNLPTTTQWGDLTSISLTAGDWDVVVLAEYSNNGAGTPLLFDCGASTTSGNSGTGLTLGDTYLEIGTDNIPTGSNVMGISVPGIRFSLSGSATVYLKVRAFYSTGTPQAQGRISARRRR